ncbi:MULTISPECIES: 7-carboxy-7-deazaguanine synthase QueE [Sphingomonadaceae]|uniref:7-carboxy-7-deazaguanine synthase QueE n=1 Tax=Sphingomonadaceae TaxID=41297 RepID=UPI0011591CAF|nr:MULTISPECIES: 7-carboxy-7-deazaguanine synthase QueE [Sphingomonadaceae]QDK33334.1 pyrroloquinoline quinone biosynthesis protein PqqE [Sphingomonas sp. IC081]QSR17961.1 pyrroloquinoline quinone biosynthesis protein PqqE [Novosphingobium sp. KA1]
MTLALATTTPGEPEVFASLQGEGASMGRPSTFVRLSRCNLACQWCDTAYTWRFTGDNRFHRDDLAFERKANQVMAEEADVARMVADLPPDRLVVTGGEPLLQGPQLARMLAALDEARPGMHVEIETNGSVAPHASLDARVQQYNVSPKLSHSGNPAELALVPERLEAWSADPRAFFKFVIAEPADVDEVRALKARYNIPAERIFLMPEGRSSDVIRQRSPWLSDICTQEGYRFTDRLHIHIWGDTRGT